MGRRKVEIKLIKNKSSRQVTFCKRRNGLMEKARQLSVLCGSSVAVIILSSTDKLYSSSSGDSMHNIIRRFETQQDDDEHKHLDLEEIARDDLSNKELLEIIQCKLEEGNDENVSVDSLTSLEEQFKTALSLTRARKTEIVVRLVKNLEEKERLLREENHIMANNLREVSSLVR